MVFACSIAVGGMSFSPVIKDETTGIALIVEAKETTTDYVATTGLNIRASASAIGKRLGSFAAGDIVKVYSITKG